MTVDDSILLCCFSSRSYPAQGVVKSLDTDTMQAWRDPVCTPVQVLKSRGEDPNLAAFRHSESCITADVGSCRLHSLDDASHRLTGTDRVLISAWKSNASLSEKETPDGVLLVAVQQLAHPPIQPMNLDIAVRIFPESELVSFSRLVRAP